MGFFTKLFESKSSAPALEAQGPCPHKMLAPRWNSVADMGERDRITGYGCQNCNRTFTAEQGRALLEEEAQPAAAPGR